MTRPPFRELEEDLADLESRMGAGEPELPIDVERFMSRGRSFAEQAEDVREVLTDEECTRLDDLLEEIAAEDPPALGAEPSAARKEFYDLVNGTAAERQLEPFLK